jgi:hypothetical protein
MLTIFNPPSLQPWYQPYPYYPYYPYQPWYPQVVYIPVPAPVYVPIPTLAVVPVQQLPEGRTEIKIEVKHYHSLSKTKSKRW